MKDAGHVSIDFFFHGEERWRGWGDLWQAHVRRGDMYDTDFIAARNRGTISGLFWALPPKSLSEAPDSIRRILYLANTVYCPVSLPNRPVCYLKYVALRY